MQILYKCRCMKAEASIDVPDRQPDGDLLEWMELVTHAIGVDHRGRSALCMATQMEYAKIPYEGGQVGTKPTVN